mmetsp:Transcript_19671/g.62375  ORF Transcript_19671/g.62375 Transcript_19671/m.62375 type:complete len:273 (+) Transcript_19671:24-842(+)
MADLTDALTACMKLRRSDAAPIRVADKLYIGTVAAARNKEALTAEGITHIVCAAAEATCYFEDDFAYLHVAVDDRSGVRISDHFEEANAFINDCIQGGGAALVHCVMGRSRSATLVCAYLMSSQGMPMLTALDLVRQARPRAQPNPSFALQLLKYQLALQSGGDGAREAERAKPAGLGSPLWMMFKTVTQVAPVVLGIVALGPSLYFAPPMPDIAQVVDAIDAGRLPLDIIMGVCAAFVVVVGMLAMAWRVGRALKRWLVSGRRHVEPRHSA